MQAVQPFRPRKGRRPAYPFAVGRGVIKAKLFRAV